MPVAIILGFDDSSTAILNRVFKKLKDNEFNSYYQLVAPHITLTSYENIDLQVVSAKLKQFCEGINPFRVLFSSYGYFPSEESVLFLNPIANRELLKIQQKVHDLFEGFPDDNSPKTWVPHSTLATNIPLERIGKAIEISKEDILMKMGAPFYIDAQSICTVEFTTDPVAIISTYEFKFKKAE
ncbi:MAG: 2'-5' RNA ligase family protein [Promethearchaeota archaeon]|jgi:2'-5' RNA ligase